MNAIKFIITVINHPNSFSSEAEKHANHQESTPLQEIRPIVAISCFADAGFQRSSFFSFSLFSYIYKRRMSADVLTYRSQKLIFMRICREILKGFSVLAFRKLATWTQYKHVVAGHTRRLLADWRAFLNPSLILKRVVFVFYLIIIGETYLRHSTAVRYKYTIG